MNLRESPVLYSSNGDKSSWIYFMVLHSRYKEKYKKNNEYLLKSTSLRILADKKRSKKLENIDWINFCELES